MQSRCDAETFFGGDVAHLRMFRRYAERVGVRVDVSLDLEPDLGPYDVVHLFNLVRVHEPYLQMRHARAAGKPVVFTPIYDDFTELAPEGRSSFSRFAFALLGKGGYELAKGAALLVRGRVRARSLAVLISRGYRHLQRELVQGADLLLPQSQAEGEILARKFGRADFRVCPLNPDEEEMRCTELPAGAPREDFVLCVGAFSERKNQLALIRALRGTGVPLVLIGGPAPYYEWYYRRCRAAAGAGVRFVQPQNRTMLMGWYRAAKVHALPSLWEATGLSNLEAGYFGCNLVVGRCPPVEEYLRDRAWYCEATQPDSIREAVLQALRAARDGKRVSEFMRLWHRWDLTANALLAAYVEARRRARRA